MKCIIILNCSVRVGPPDQEWKDQGFSFTLFTPERIFNLSAETSEERSEWLEEIQKVLDRPLTPKDTSCKCIAIIVKSIYLVLFLALPF